jgi:PPK2 family polyphosphate:nucleotide phosphotransferase
MGRVGAFRIDKPQAIDLAKIPTRAPDDADKDEHGKRAEAAGDRLDELEELLYAAGTHSVLIVLQGMDTSGKDGTIRRIFRHSNAQGTRVAPFKVPTPEELAHDFLWRVHRQAPAKGEIVVFNRSHYEDVLVVRVHGLVPEDRWKARYARINEFERLLADSGTIVRKYFLHISKEEQERRLLDREAEEEKAWKLSARDWEERERWDAYQRAYEDALGQCSAEHAPWTVVPADQKWYRDCVVLEDLVGALEPHVAGWRERLRDIGAKAKAELAEFRAGAG